MLIAIAIGQERARARDQHSYSLLQAHKNYGVKPGELLDISFFNHNRSCSGSGHTALPSEKSSESAVP